jgi:hypothetical protein
MSSANLRPEVRPFPAPATSHLRPIRFLIHKRHHQNLLSRPYRPHRPLRRFVRAPLRRPVLALLTASFATLQHRRVDHDPFRRASTPSSRSRNWSRVRPFPHRLGSNPSPLYTRSLAASAAPPRCNSPPARRSVSPEKKTSTLSSTPMGSTLFNKTRTSSRAIREQSSLQTWSSSRGSATPLSVSPLLSLLQSPP